MWELHGPSWPALEEQITHTQKIVRLGNLLYRRLVSLDRDPDGEAPWSIISESARCQHRGVYTTNSSWLWVELCPILSTSRSSNKKTTLLRPSYTIDPVDHRYQSSGDCLTNC